MVAGPYYHCYAFTGRIDHFRRQLGRCTFYLFIVLNEVAG